MATISILDLDINEPIDRIIFDVDEDNDSAILVKRDDGMVRIVDLCGDTVDVNLARLKLAIGKAIELGWDKPEQQIAQE